jgi:hypothetical protein
MEILELRGGWNHLMIMGDMLGPMDVAETGEVELSKIPCLLALCVFKKYLLQNSLSHIAQYAS